MMTKTEGKWSTKTTLNQKLLEGATAKGKPCYDYYDALCVGLTLRVSEHGKKTWTFVFTNPGDEKRARLALGHFPALGLADARTAAEAARVLVQAGRDPRTQDPKRVEKTIAELCEDRIARVLRPKGRPALRTADDIERYYRKDIIPYIGTVTVKAFVVSDYNTVIDEIEDREAFVLGNRVHSQLKALMAFAVERGEREYSPISAKKPPFDENHRTRWLSLEEITHFWHRCPQALIRSPKVQRILKLCLATGKRSNEVCGAKRAEINFVTKTWTIPKDRVKGRDGKVSDELVPLSDLAVALFQEAIRCSNRDYLFPNEEGEGAYEPGVVAKAVKLSLEPNDDLPKGRFGMEKWTAHDLRRTVGTQLLRKENGLDVTKDQKYLVLNHLSEFNKNVSDRVYDQNDYLPEKREALEKWGNFLANLVGFQFEQKEAA